MLLSNARQKNCYRTDKTISSENIKPPGKEKPDEWLHIESHNILDFQNCSGWYAFVSLNIKRAHVRAHTRRKREIAENL